MAISQQSRDETRKCWTTSKLVLEHVMASKSLACKQQETVGEGLNALRSGRN